jgi:hypothetical protein
MFPPNSPPGSALGPSQAQPPTCPAPLCGGLAGVFQLGCVPTWLCWCARCTCRSRGIDPPSARQMLVYSFGREVVQGLRDEALIGRVEDAVQRCLASANIFGAAEEEEAVVA